MSSKICSYCEGTGRLGFQREGCCYCDAKGFIETKVKNTHNALLKISGIYEKDGITLKESHQFRVGRIGKIVNLNIGTPLCLIYSETGKMLMTSDVVDYQEDDYGALIETSNSVYRLDYV